MFLDVQIYYSTKTLNVRNCSDRTELPDQAEPRVLALRHKSAQTVCRAVIGLYFVLRPPGDKISFIQVETRMKFQRRRHQHSGFR